MVAKNTDKEIWRKTPGDYYSPSIHITESGGVGIDVGGHVLVAPIERWHEAGVAAFCVPDPNAKSSVNLFHPCPTKKSRKPNRSRKRKKTNEMAR